MAIERLWGGNTRAPSGELGGGAGRAARSELGGGAPRAARGGLGRRVVRALAAALALGATAGCGRDAAAPQLLSVDELAPLVLGEGEALEIRGAGFAPKRSARVTFRGTLHRPGAEPEAGWAASAEGVAESAQRLSLPVPEALRARFCGPAGAATHATFRGEVDVAFEPLTPGALPVRGTLAGVVLDVYPAGAYPSEAQRAEAARALEAMGLTLAGDGEGEGGSLLVASVEPEGPAELAGVAAGDRLESLDGVRLLDAADALPSGRHPYAVLGVRRPEPGESFERQVLLRSFRRRRGSAEFGLAGALLALAAGSLLFVASPLARALTWRASRARGPSALRPALPKGALGLSAVVAAAFTALPLVGAGAWPEGSSFLALGAALATGLPARGAGGEGGLVRRAWSIAKRAVLGVVPVAAAWACGSALAGSLWVADVVNVQGGLPWQWAAFASPLGLLLAALFVSPALFKVERGAGAAEAPSRREWALGLVRAGLAVAWFGGGWRLPGVDAAEQASRLGWRAGGALVFLVKIWALALALEALRAGWRALPARRVEARWARVCWPLSALAAALSAASIAWPPSLWAPGALGWATFGAALWAGAYAAFVSARGARRVPVSPAL
ncbi:MAG TPA: PDZ domain-containing protein [Polyangiaceae bacterium]|nr:PDZ domain-containing protein [Polyangiaceae bacterium]